MKNIIFVHTEGSINNTCKPLLIPIGTTSLANLLSKQGYQVEIIHVELEKQLNNKFDIIKYLKFKNPALVCMDLHWHYHSFKVMKLAKKIKRKIKETRIIIGGYTASYFATEIINNYKFIDFVIKGDAEIPILKIAECINKTDDFRLIPNLIWRKKNYFFIKKSNVISNAQTYIIDNKSCESLSFSDFSLLKNNEYYKKIHFLSIFEKDIEKDLNIFYYNCGRGCSMNCTFCGAGAEAQKLINNRCAPISYSIDTVIKELKRAVLNNYHVWFSDWEPPQPNNYFVNLFKEIRDQEIKIISLFTFWFLPDLQIIGEFSKTFDVKNSHILISPDSGSEKIRRLNKNQNYTNNELLDVLTYCQKCNINTILFFTAGLSFETKEDFLLTIKLIREINRINKKIKIIISKIDIEPASPRQRNGNRLGIHSEVKSFKDFVKMHSKKSKNIGYNTEFLDKNDIDSMVVLLRAQNFCRYENSNFLNYMENESCIRNINISKLHLLCKKCPNYSLCFTK